LALWGVLVGEPLTCGSSTVVDIFDFLIFYM